MGIETATLAAIATAVSAGASVVGTLMKKSPSAPTAPEPAKPPTESKTPDADVFRTKNAARGSGDGTAGGTMLTPLGGVPATALNLGRNTLLGA